MDLTRFLSKPHKEAAVNTLPYEKAYDTFCTSIVVPKIIEAKKILLLTSLRKSFIKIVKEVEGVDTSYRSANLKNRLAKSFPQLQFTLARPLGYVVYSGAVEASDLVKSAFDEMSSDQDSQESQKSHDGVQADYTSPTTTKTVYEVLRTNYMSAKIVKSAVENSVSKFSTSWPPTAENLNVDIAKSLVPHQLFNWIAWTTWLNDDPQADTYATVGTTEEKKILSIAQDIMYLHAKGRVSTPKHHALSMTIRHMTGSSEIIQILNGLGHCTSHSATLEHDTALAMVELSRGEFPIPSGIKHGQFTTLVWDNIDFGEETLSGKGTTHSTNCIMIQRDIHEDVSTNPDPELVAISKKKQRSVKAPSTNLEPYFGTSRSKDGPGCIGKSVDITSDPHDASRLKPKLLDQAFVLARMDAADKGTRKIPSWTGFNTQLSTSIPNQSVVGYLPVIDASPTEMDTVNTILVRSMKYADLLHLAEIVLVFDQAIYAKAMKIIWEGSNEEFRRRIIVRLGAFHTKMSYLACIGIRYKDAGLSDIFVESGLVASGSLAGVMNGKHYNRAVRAHKIASEALQRLRLRRFLDSISEEEARDIHDLMANLSYTYSSENRGELSENQQLIRMLAAYNQFIESESQQNSNFAFWFPTLKWLESFYCSQEQLVKVIGHCIFQLFETCYHGTFPIIE